MQHNITRGDIVLLGETIRLLTLSSQPRGELPRRYTPTSTTGFLHHRGAPRIQCYRRERSCTIQGSSRFKP